MLSRPKYMIPINEAELFEWGATQWRMDIATWQTMKKVIASANWHRPDDIPDDIEGHIADAPLGSLSPKAEIALAEAISTMVNDPSLIPGISQTGHFKVSGMEIQNGSFDAGWHHDGLAGKRMGHAGDFFLIAYFGESAWQDEWGGHFQYAKRDLAPGWPTSEFHPNSDIRQIAPSERTTLIGWNQNPRLIHRALPLHAPKNRITLIASLDFEAR